MTIEAILDNVFFYLQVTPSPTDSAVALSRANGLCAAALRRHAFQSQKKLVGLTWLAGEQVFLAHDGAELYDISSASLLVPGGSFQPLKLTTQAAHEIELASFTLSGLEPGSNGLIPPWWDSSGFVRRFVVVGRSAYLWPPIDQGTTHHYVTLTAVVAPPLLELGQADDVTTNSFFLEHGSEWLTWALVCDLNFKYQVFVPRQEGMLPPPFQQRDELWQALVAFDETRVQPANEVR
jgi:hypothetical protein